MARQIIYKTYCEELNCNGADYEYVIIHMLNSKNLIIQIIDAKTGIELDKSLYTIIRKNLNSIELLFNSAPINGEKYNILMVKCD